MMIQAYKKPCTLSFCLDSFFVTAWNNGLHKKSGAGYGFKISVKDRDAFFNKKHIFVSLKFPNGHISNVNVNKKSFWNEQCRELISKDIGKWMIENKIAPWSKGNPPKLKMLKIENTLFSLSDK